MCSGEPRPDDTEPPRPGCRIAIPLGDLFPFPAQEEAARRSKARLEASKRFRGPIVTEIEPAADFIAPWTITQQYLEKRGLASCHVSPG